MHNQTCCFTGHRIIPKDNYTKIQKHLELEVIKLIYQGIQHFCCGGAIGFDQLAGFTVLNLKKQFPHITLIMVLPCAEQDKKWRQIDKERYHSLLLSCDKKIFLQQEYDNNCMFKRNRYFIDNSCVCVAYFNNRRGATFHTINYAHHKNIPLINIAEDILL